MNYIQIENILDRYIDIDVEQKNMIIDDILTLEKNQLVNKIELRKLLSLSTRSLDEMIRRELLTNIKINQKIILFDLQKVKEELEAFNVKSVLYKLNKEKLKELSCGTGKK